MKTKVNIKKLIISVILIVGIFVAAWIIFDSTFPNMALHSEVASRAPRTHQTFEHSNAALIVGSDGLAAVNRRGDVVWNTNERFSFPFADVRGNYILHGARRGQDAIVYRNRREIYRVEMNESIRLGRVNSNGYSAIVTEAMGFNAMVTVFNRRGDEVYRWFVGDGYIVDVDIARDNRTLAIAKYSYAGTGILSTVTFVDIVRDDVLSIVTRYESLIFSIRFNRDGTLASVSDTEFLRLNRDGRLRHEVNFGGRQLSTFNIDSENTMVFAFVTSRGNTTVEIYNRDGMLRGSYQSQGRLRNITVSGDIILLSRLRTVVRISPNGRTEEVVTVPYDIKSLQIMGGRRHALIVGGNNASIVRL